ncbi:putative Protein VAC14-like protein [Naja naja]|nr:putative Protein VAC14-like protein [Naja naja]
MTKQTRAGSPCQLLKERLAKKRLAPRQSSPRVDAWMSPVSRILVAPASLCLPVLKWLYHLYIKTPRKMFRHTDSLFPILLKTLSDDSDEVILKDLEVLAEIASSPAGQMEGRGLQEGPGLRLDLPVPISAKRAKSMGCSPSTPTMNSYFYQFMINLLKRFSSERKLLEIRGAFIISSAYS